MTKFEIIEEGAVFATIEADDADTALALAIDEYPRRRQDYNLGPDDEGFTVEWFAREVGSDFRASSMRVSVPSL